MRGLFDLGKAAILKDEACVGGFTVYAEIGLALDFLADSYFGFVFISILMVDVCWRSSLSGMSLLVPAVAGLILRFLDYCF